MWTSYKYKIGIKRHLLYNQNQQLTTTCIHGVINVRSDDIFNHVNVAMNKFNRRLFKLNHRSSYTRLNIDIFDEYRTIANVGMLKTQPVHTKLVEIDITIAYTAAFIKIKEVPVFNEFDAFKPYNQQDIHNNNLYIVKSNRFYLFMNKK